MKKTKSPDRCKRVCLYRNTNILSPSSIMLVWLEMQLCPPLPALRLQPSLQPRTPTHTGVWSLQLLLATRASVWQSLPVL